MHDMAKRGMAFAVTTGGLLLAGAGIASADATAATSGAGGVLSGNAVQVPAILGINACGDQAGVLSASGPGEMASCSIAESAPSATAMTSGAGGVLSGNTAQVPIDVPVNLCGNSVLAAAAALNAASTDCAVSAAGSSSSTSGMSSIGVMAPGSIANTGTTSTSTAGSASGSASSTAAGSTSGSSSSSGSTAVAGTTGAGGVLSGNTVQLPIDVPVNLCGNLVSILGVLDSLGPVSCTEGAPAPMPSTSASSSPSPTPSASSSSNPTPSAGSSSSVSLSTSQTSQGSNFGGQIGAVQPLNPIQPIADPVVFWPRPGTAQHVNMPQRPVPAKVTCDVEPSAHTEALGVGPGGALGTVGATAAAFASGTGLRVLGRRRRRRH